MIFNYKSTFFIAIVGLGLGTGISGCSVSSMPFLGEQPTASSASPAPIAATSPAASTEPAASPSPSPAQKPKPPSRPPLTVEKLKNTEYYILADGPVKLAKGTFTDDKKRVFTLGEPVAYGDLNRDGIKDAIAPLTINIDGRKFTYLVGVINEKGEPRHASAEFLGERAKVKTLSANAGKITVKMDKYSPGDPDGSPSQTVTREYSFKPFKSLEEEKKEKDKAKDDKSKDKKPEATKSSTDKKEETKSSPSPNASPKS